MPTAALEATIGAGARCEILWIDVDLFRTPRPGARGLLTIDGPFEADEVAGTLDRRG